jgi:hypothetical protein
MDVKRFRGDLSTLAHRICRQDDEDVRSKVFRIVHTLANLHSRNLVKINHSALELVCAHRLLREGFDVQVEHRLSGTLVCDLFGSRNAETRIIEIETGFIPPEAALRPGTYVRSRIASKIARYSRFASNFALGTTPSYVLEIPRFFVSSPQMRTREDAEGLKRLTDVYYNSPSITLAELMGAKLNSILVIDVDSGETDEIDPDTYMRRVSAYGGHRPKSKP